jgi:ribonucleoside-diphosphate reductase alpha chain
MISLSDLGDDRMAKAKAGNWWDGNGQRALANNSAVYDVKPDVGQFMREWSNIYESHSGERGIFNRYASEIQASKNGRRAAKVVVTLEDGSKKTFDANKFVGGTLAKDLKVGDSV